MRYKLKALCLFSATLAALAAAPPRFRTTTGVHIEIGQPKSRPFA